MNQEPYESMPEGKPHAKADYVATLVAIAAMVIGVAALVLPQSSKAANNWCGEWASGFEVGYCWSRKSCTYIPPQTCPYPKEGETDGYMRGLTDGLSTKEKGV